MSTVGDDMEKKSLASEYPDIATEWHPTKNGDLLPEDVAPKSGKKVWWVGKCGHEWQAKVYARTNGHGCPYCSNNKVLSGYNDLATARPDLAEEWHPSKNGNLMADMVAPLSNKKVWWLGKCGHEWQAVVEGRYYGNGCPICANQVILPGFNDLKTTNPEIAAEWHPTRNGNLRPEMVASQSNKKVWWLGKCGHEWKATVSHRVNDRGCPICSNKKVLIGYNDLESTHPQLSREWHPTKNGELTPSMIVAGAHKKVWWMCEKGHEWQATVKDRVEGTGCPACSSKQIIKGENDLATKLPNLAAEWHPTKNGNLMPDSVAPFSHIKVWWMCEKGHEWQAYVSSRARGNRCPVCGKEFHTSFPEQAILYYIRKQYPDAENGNKAAIGIELDIYIPSKRIAVEYDGYTWHKDNKSEIKKNELCIENNIQLVRIREEGLKAYNDCTCIIRKDRKNNNSLNGVISLLFQAISCSETIDIDVGRDEGKIYETYISSQKDNSLERKSPNIATEWHPTKNGKLRPDMVSYGSKKKVWWLGKCGHEWQATVDSRSRGNGCPICANQQLLVGFNDLATVSPNVAREWHPTKNGSLEPTMVSPKANKKVWWLGKCGHEWEALISSRTNGRGCPYCSNKAILPGFNDLETINPELASEWHPVKNGSLTASSVSPKSSKKVWWLGKCGHEWQATVNDRANGTGCPVCRRKKLS